MLRTAVILSLFVGIAGPPGFLVPAGTSARGPSSTLVQEAAPVPPAALHRGADFGPTMDPDG